MKARGDLGRAMMALQEARLEVLRALRDYQAEVGRDTGSEALAEAMIDAFALIDAPEVLRFVEGPLFGIPGELVDFEAARARRTGVAG